jgi:hypothetical protein
MRKILPLLALSMMPAACSTVQQHTRLEPTGFEFFMYTDHPQSWDQETLKAHDSGCPSAIYVAPDGVLEQC